LHFQKYSTGNLTTDAKSVEQKPNDIFTPPQKQKTKNKNKTNFVASSFDSNSSSAPTYFAIHMVI